MIEGRSGGARPFLGPGLVLAMLAARGIVAEAAAGTAEVIAVEAQQEAAGTWRFSVTVRHADAGWDHYADSWQVLSPNGEVLGERTLLHPHDNEQPFTRALAGVAIPKDIPEVQIRAHDNVHGWGEPIPVDLPPR